MTLNVNELIGKIEMRIKELGKMPTRELLYEHPDLADGNAAGMKYGLTTARKMMKGKSREDIIAEILVEEFSTE
jgi:hypothetical protein